MAIDCNFGTALDRMLRDRLVCGLRDASLQKGFLAEKDLTLQNVVDQSLSSEAANLNVKAMRPQESVHAVKSGRSRHKNAAGDKQQPCTVGRTEQASWTKVFYDGNWFGSLLRTKNCMRDGGLKCNPGEIWAKNFFSHLLHLKNSSKSGLHLIAHFYMAKLEPIE